jgi:hypothetical protein
VAESRQVRMLRDFGMSLARERANATVRLRLPVSYDVAVAAVQSSYRRGVVHGVGFVLALVLAVVLVRTWPW